MVLGFLRSLASGSVPLLAFAIAQSFTLVLRKVLAKRLMDFPLVLSIAQPMGTAFSFAVVSGILWALAGSPLCGVIWLGRTKSTKSASSSASSTSSPAKKNKKPLDPYASPGSSSSDSCSDSAALNSSSLEPTSTLAPEIIGDSRRRAWLYRESLSAVERERLRLYKKRHGRDSFTDTSLGATPFASPLRSSAFPTQSPRVVREHLLAGTKSRTGGSTQSPVGGASSYPGPGHVGEFVGLDDSVDDGVASGLNSSLFSPGSAPRSKTTVGIPRNNNQQHQQQPPPWSIEVAEETVFFPSSEEDDPSSSLATPQILFAPETGSLLVRTLGKHDIRAQHQTRLISGGTAGKSANKTKKHRKQRHDGGITSENDTDYMSGLDGPAAADDESGNDSDFSIHNHVYAAECTDERCATAAYALDVAAEDAGDGLGPGRGHAPPGVHGGWRHWPMWRLRESQRWRASFKVPMVKFMIMGALFTMANFMLFSGMRGDLVPGPVAVLLQQAVIPLTFVFSVLALRSRFTLLQGIGSLLIVAGIFLTVAPQLVEHHSIQSKDWYALALILGSSVPLSVAIVFMQHALQGGEKALQVVYLWFLLNVFEFIFIWPLAPAIMPIQKLPIKAIPENLRDGFLCLVWGDQSVHNPYVDHAHQYDFKCESDSSIGLYLLFIGALVVTKVLQGYIVQTQSGALMWLAAAAAVPLSEGGFCLIGQCDANGFTWGGLAVVCVGLIIFRWPRRGFLGRDSRVSLNESDGEN